MTREFRIADVVQQDESVVLRSAERSQPKTPGRLVKLKPTASNAPNNNDQSEQN